MNPETCTNYDGPHCAWRPYGDLYYRWSHMLNCFGKIQLIHLYAGFGRNV
jgi:hypothetical protein